MDAIFCIVLSFIVIRWWWKYDEDAYDGRNTVKNRFRKRKRKLTDEELIAAVLPTINKDK